jgi:DNA-binding IclR family transcriptional regulator
VSDRPSSTHYVGGAQTVRRAVVVLRFLATGGADGWALGDVVNAAGLTKGTAHRLLAALMAEDLVDQEATTRRYRLRVDLLGLRPDLDWYEPLRRLVEPSLRELADTLGDTVFLSVRNGFDALCIACELGGFPIRTFPYNVGERRPLGVGASGLAILGALDQENVDRVLSFNRGRLRAHKNFAPHELLALVERTRRDGYSVIDGLIVPGMVAIGIAFTDLAQRSTLALSAAGIADRMPRSRRPEVVAALRHARDSIDATVRADLRQSGVPRRSLRRGARERV